MITSLLAIKVVAAVVILVVGVVGGVIPLLAARHHASRRFLSLGNSLAGGIFPVAGFIHLLPEAGAALGEMIEYPPAPLLAAIGVCVLLLIDRVLFETTRAGGGGTHQPIYPLVLLVVLSVHSIIAGIALGLEAEVAASVLVMLAILLHKGSAAFALMVSVHASGADMRRLWAVLTIFVVMTPLGIVRCLRCLLLMMCTHPFAKKALTLHLVRSEGHERYFGCSLMHRNVLASSHQHLMAEAPRWDEPKLDASFMAVIEGPLRH